MLISLKWLDEYVDVPEDVSAFCDRLDLTGTGVEGVEKTGDVFERIVTAKVLEKTPHPDSDHMWVCQVDVGDCSLDDAGNPAPIQVVCGAQNFNEGDHIVTALVGATLPGDIHIKKSKLRGVMSCGMNCSERELGLSQDHGGIMILPEGTPTGMPFADYIHTTDTILDLEITPNRPDCLSVVGMAREVGAMYLADVRYPLEADAAKLEGYLNDREVSDDVTVHITDESRCNRYAARVIDDVKIGPSPAWLAERVVASGARSINNVVDATNYIMFLYGQPLHAFDAKSLTGPEGKMEVIVRPAHQGEEFTTLDGVERVLTEDMTVIATPERAVALAGVMGGLDSEVEDDTTCILLETATFDRSHTSRTSRNLGLISEASMRYERGVDDVPIEEISEAAAALIAEVAGGTVRKGVVDVYPHATEPYDLTFRIERFQRFVGADIPEVFIEDVLARLGCVVTSAGDGALAVITPTFRPDLEREIDLYEEVLRLWGMDRVESTLPASPKRVGMRTHEQTIIRKLHEVLTGSGISETMTYSFVEPTDLSRLRFDEEVLDANVELLNPLNSDQSVMRQSILPGLLKSLAYNLSHSVKNVQLYEIGTVFSTSQGRKKPKEKKKLAGVLAGSMAENSWNATYPPFDFFDGKGVFENIAWELALPKVHFKPASAESYPFLQPGRGAEMYSGGSLLGFVGELHPAIVADFDLIAPVVVFELDVANLVKSARPARDYRDVPIYPPVEIDQAFVVDEEITNERMMQVIASAGGNLLDDVVLFDVYRDDERVGANKKSMAYKLTYRVADRTLTNEEVDRAHAKLLKKVQGATGAEVRG